MNKRFKGFTLMEMMVVMLIVTIILAASAPLMTKKKTLDVNQSPWQWASNSVDTYFGTDKDSTAIIGDDNDNGQHTRLYIKTSYNFNDDNNKKKRSHIILVDDNGKVLLRKFKNSLLFNSLDEFDGSSYERNTAFGVNSIGAANSSNLGNDNTAFGYSALEDLDGGSNNTAVGSTVLSANTTGENNVAVGSTTLVSNTTGSSNVAVGHSALFSNTTASNNVAIGGEALRSNITGNGNVAIGKEALKLNTNSNNVAVGNQALMNNSTGHLNIAIGGALLRNTTGDNNIGIGSEALYSNTNQSNNIAIGVRALESDAGVGGNVAIGTDALNTDKGAYDLSKNDYRLTAIGDNACNINSGGKFENVICLGHSSGSSKVSYTDGSVNTSLRYSDSVYIGNARSEHFYFGDFYVNKNALKDAIAPYNKNYSDARLKNISGKSEDGLEKIKQLEVFNFTFKNDKDKTPHVGVIAQKLQKIFPDAVTKGDDGYLTIRKEDMFYAMVNAIKELDNKIQAIINELKVEVQRITKIESEIKTLQKENKELKLKNKELENRINKLEKTLLN